tara:strand:+ start:657 stop:962 length:306 start_codon:yes stop_codon:yes gene_type:complete
MMSLSELHAEMKKIQAEEEEKDRIYVVYMVGCIECNVPSGIYAVLDNKEDAEAMVKDRNEKYCTWKIWGGQGYWSYQAMKMGALNPDYPFDKEDVNEEGEE